MFQASAVLQLLSCVQLFATPKTAALQASPSFAVSPGLLKFMSSEWVMPSNHLILCRPLLLQSSIFPSIRGFSNEPALHIKWPKCWSFSLSLSNDYSRLISFRIVWFDLLAVWGTLKSLLQHHSSTIFGNFLEKYHSFLWNLPTLFYFKPRPGDTITSVDPFE